MKRLAPLMLALWFAASGLGCSSKAKTPEEAYRRFSKAVTERDGGALFDALDQTCRWAWMSIQKYHREAYDIILSNYPEEARQRELKRYEKGAIAPSARELFKDEVAPMLFLMFRPLVVPNPRIEVLPQGDAAEVVLPSAARVRFNRGKDKSWGFGGLDKQCDDRQTRAFHDLEQVRASAADYERAAARTTP